MSDPEVSEFNYGRAGGYIFRFRRGDRVPMHRHDVSTVHITIFTTGRFRVHGPEIGVREYGPGDVVDFDVDVEHEIEALEDGTAVSVLK